jgi:ferredoxin--NADP+ reductase
MDELMVDRLRWLSPDLFELSLERRGTPFTPGDCLALYGSGTSRPYSIASGVDEDVLRFVVRRIPGGVVSTYLASREPGQRLRVSAPFGWFRPTRGGAAGVDSVFVATGTGVAPFLSALRSDGEESPVFLYGVRLGADAVALPFLRERCKLSLAVSGERVPGHHYGRVTELLEELPRAPDIHYYLCGLDAMIDEVTHWLESREVDPTRIHREVFFHA